MLDVVWFGLSGLWVLLCSCRLAHVHLLTGIPTCRTIFGVPTCRTIIGIPLTIANSKLIALAFLSLGREIVSIGDGERLGRAAA
jgi:uncharacterized membrane protein YccF (DUF307 family)